VVLAIVDDLLFVSKIKAAAGALGVALTVTRSMDAAIEQMRQTAPSLVILDLNSTRTDPLGTVRNSHSRVRVARNDRRHQRGTERGCRRGARPIGLHGTSR
jgi:ActR/RegA family two-component response regulator